VPIARPARWGLAALAAAAVATTTLLYARLQLPSAPSLAAVAARSTLTPRDLQHGAWYRMRLLHAEVAFHPVTIAAPPIEMPAAAGILVDVDTGAILWQHNEHRQLPPASTIKVLTAMVALTNFAPDRAVTVTPDALFQAGDESKMYLKAGETLSVQELLTGMLTVSANDAADALAIDTVGMERFVGAMNAQIGALHLHDTHAATPVGLSAPGQFSSAYDLAVLATIDENTFPTFADIVRTRYVELPASSTHPAFALGNVNALLGIYPPAIGIKPGWTGDAGACEIGMAVRDGHRLLSVLLDGERVYPETRRLLDWGFVQEGLPSQLPTPKPSPAPA
jgi:D-alanyl-D-alanine carboxypeptidase (penicillin-binding protein 5/6)